MAERYVIAGLSRLTVRVAALLSARGAEVVVVGSDVPIVSGGPGSRTLATLLDPSVSHRADDSDLRVAFAAAGLTKASCMLALADDDLENLQAVVVAQAIAPHVPVVLRMFDPEIADQLQFGAAIRRAYSLSALAAPAFVAAALGEEVVETLRLGDAELPLCRLDVTPGSPLVGRRPAEVEHGWHCTMIARADVSAQWQTADQSAGPLAPGEQVLVGGLQHDVLRLAADASGWPGGGRDRRWGPRWRGSRLRWAERPQGSRRAAGLTVRSTLLPGSALLLGVVLVVVTIVYRVVEDRGAVDSLVTAVNAVLGNAANDGGTGLRLFGIIAAVTAVGLTSVLLAYLAAFVLAQRLDQRAVRAAGQMRGHVIVAGLGTVGYRIVSALGELGIDVVVIERATENRFSEAVSERVPVLVGDVRLPENLDRAGISRARCLIAVTDDDLTNITAASSARRFNPTIRSIARVFDETLATGADQAFGFDAVISGAAFAAPAFATAAFDERAVRRVSLGSLELRAMRHAVVTPIEPEALARWWGWGLRIVAVRRTTDRTVQRASANALGLGSGDVVVIVGPPEVVEAFTGDRSAGTASG